ncbi:MULTISPECIES: hypothetical protein [unclassified Nonomuraea]|uniref:hypothetical protein n=1 Tax=unclassified Nonomuraea TaxID=2593643 RepID=UPI0033FD71C4
MDGYSNLTRVANRICWAADWKTMCSRPTVAKIVERTGLGKATVKRWVRWLRERGWLGVVEQGTTVRYRKGTKAGLDDDGYGNRAAVWVLCVPRRPFAKPENDQPADLHEGTSEPPSVSLRRRETKCPTRAREADSSSRDHSRISPAWTLHATARTKRDRLWACERLRQECLPLRRMTAWYLRWMLKPLFEAGWTVADVLHALDVRADDSVWAYTWSSTSELRHVPGWVRHRLSAWLDKDGEVLPSRSQRAAAALAAQRAEQEARRREWEERAAAAGVELAPGPRVSREEALAPVPVAVRAEGPNEAFRRARAELERRRQEREAQTIASALARAR